MLKKVLEAREARWNHRLELVRKNSRPLVTLCLNIPGSDKTRSLFVEAHEKLLSELIRYFEDNKIQVLYIESRAGLDGPEAFLVVDCEAVKVKKLALDLEETHPIGRLMDIDVMDENFGCLSRERFSLPPRKCILCDSPARECIVLRRHDRNEVIAKVVPLIEKYLGRGSSCGFRKMNSTQ